MGAVPENGDPIGDFERFLQRVADEDDRNPFLAQPIDQGEEMMLFLRGQGGGRLVEDDDFRLEANRARDFDHLPLGGAKRLDDRRRIDGKVQRLKQLLRLDIGAAQAVEELFVAQIEILRDRQRGNEARLLIDHRNPVSPRVRGAGDLDPLAVEADFALGGVTAPERILTSVDLPAPFSPTMACTSPRRKSKSMSFSAATPRYSLDDASHLEQRRFRGRHRANPS